MVSTMVSGDIIGKNWVLFITLGHISYLVLRRGPKPWVMTVLAVVVTVLCLRANSNDMAGPWVYLLYLLGRAMEVFTCNKSWPRLSTPVRHSPETFWGVLALSYILQGLVRISVLLFPAGSPFLRVWLGPKFPEPSLSQISCLVLFLYVPLCLAPTALKCVQRFGRSVEFSYDQEAQYTAEGLGRLQRLKSLRMDSGVRIVARSRQVYIELVAEVLLITVYLSWGRAYTCRHKEI
jgi:hypothetical protein